MDIAFFWRPQGEPYIALLLLWEADHKQEYSFQAAEVAGRLSSFTKHLKVAVAKDDQLSRWLVSKSLCRRLAPGLPQLHYLYWSVRCDVKVGEPFLGM